MRRAAMGCLLLLGAACGPTKEETANVEALAPLVHRNRALTEEFSTWFVNNEVPGMVSWQTIFEQYDKMVAAKESVLAQIRQIVPTPRYDCLVGLAARNLQADIDALTARRSYLHQIFKSRSALEAVNRSLASARPMRDGSEYYLSAARASLAEATEANTQAAAFRPSSNSGAIRAAKVSDTLVRAALAARLLPSMAYPGYPLVADPGSDSLFFSRDSLMPPPCRSQ